MSRTRVLRIIARMNVGGPAVQVVGLTKGLNTDEFESRLLVGSVADGEADYLDLRAPGAPAVRVPGLGRSVRIWGDLRAFVQIVKEIRRFRPHVVHTHTAKAGVLGRIAARVCGVRWVVHTYHGHLLHGYFSPRATKAVALVERSLAKITTTIVAVGSQVRDDLLKAGIGHPDQYVVVPPGIALPSPPTKPRARQLLEIDPEADVVLFVARLTSIKRPERFIEVARLLGDRHPRAVFVVAGGGDLLEDLRLMAEPLGQRVRLLGWCSDVETLYAASDLIVLTSDNEGMPVSLIEAATLGVPAVGSNVGSVSEVVVDGETGILTDTDPSAIAAAVSQLLEDDALRAKMGLAAAERARRLFSSERLVQDTADLYRSFAASETSQGGG